MAWGKVWKKIEKIIWPLLATWCCEWISFHSHNIILIYVIYFEERILLYPTSWANKSTLSFGRETVAAIFSIGKEALSLVRSQRSQQSRKTLNSIHQGYQQVFVIYDPSTHCCFKSLQLTLINIPHGYQQWCEINNPGKDFYYESFSSSSHPMDVNRIYVIAISFVIGKLRFWSKKTKQHPWEFFQEIWIRQEKINMKKIMRQREDFR